MNPRNDGLDSQMLTSPMSEGRKTWTALAPAMSFPATGGGLQEPLENDQQTFGNKTVQVACYFFGLNQASSSL